LIVSGAAARLDAIWRDRGMGTSTSHQVMCLASGGELLAGIGAVVLGILAVSGVNPLPLATIGVLSLGVAALVSGSSAAGRVLAVFG
jgi:hypothetical protein